MTTQGERNPTRRQRALAVLEHYKYGLLREAGPVTADEVSTDLVADLCHLLGHEGHDPEAVFSVALNHYRHESNPENSEEEDGC